MCWSIYIASDEQLTLVPPDPAKPAFYVMAEEDEKFASVVRRHLSQKYLCFAGGISGCGCDFWSSAEERKNLAGYLAAELSQKKKIDLFICWAGDEGREHLLEKDWDSTTLLTEHEGLPERALLHIIR